jgi:plasmid stabilization system protein ParE
MNRRLVVRPEAKEDIAKAYGWYWERGENLGRDFLEELGSLFRTIEAYPHAFPKVHGEKRRALLKRFPWAVFYRLPADEILILAVFHQACDPRRWKILR